LPVIAFGKARLYSIKEVARWIEAQRSTRRAKDQRGALAEALLAQ